MNDQPNENFELTWQELDLATELLLSAYKAIPDSVIHYKDKAYDLFKKFVKEMVKREREFHSERHATWERQYSKEDESTKNYRCDQCGREVVVPRGESVVETYPYCHCGARMIAWKGE